MLSLVFLWCQDEGALTWYDKGMVKTVLEKNENLTVFETLKNNDFRRSYDTFCPRIFP